MPIPLRLDYDAARVRMVARESQNANQVRRLLALAAIYDGRQRAEAAGIGGVTLQIVRDWVLRFNADGPDGLIDRKAPGQPSRLNGGASGGAGRGDRERADPGGARRGALADRRSVPVVVGASSRSAISKQTLGRELRAMGYRKLSARPRHHAQAEGAIERFKKLSPRRLDAIAREQGVERRP